jgi:hypothetical protein
MNLRIARYDIALGASHQREIIIRLHAGEISPGLFQLEHFNFLTNNLVDLIMTQTIRIGHA